MILDLRHKIGRIICLLLHRGVLAPVGIRNLMTAGINGRAVADALAKEPDRVTSVELFILAPPVETVAPGSTPVGSSPPTPPPDWGQF